MQSDRFWRLPSEENAEMGHDGEINGIVRYRTRRFKDSGFAEHAAVEAVDCAIRDAQSASRALERHIDWLREVRASRRASQFRTDHPDMKQGGDG